MSYGSSTFVDNGNINQRTRDLLVLKYPPVQKETFQYFKLVTNGRLDGKTVSRGVYLV